MLGESTKGFYISTDFKKQGTQLRLLSLVKIIKYQPLARHCWEHHIYSDGSNTIYYGISVCVPTGTDSRLSLLF